jgi:hypothetical protein
MKLRCPTSRRLAAESGIRSESPGTADFILARKENILTLPSSVVLERDGEASVFVIDHGKAWQRHLRIGLRNEESLEVVSGLQAAEQVIQRGRNKVKDGQAVEVLNGR